MELITLLLSQDETKTLLPELKKRFKGATILEGLTLSPFNTFVVHTTEQDKFVGFVEGFLRARAIENLEEKVSVCNTET